MATREEKQAYINEMAEKRGYVLDYHKVMTEYDFDVLQAANGLVNAAYLKERRLDRKTKELLFIVSLTVMRASNRPSKSTKAVPGRGKNARCRRRPGAG